MKYYFASIGWGHISAFAGWVFLLLMIYLVYRLIFNRSRKVVIASGLVVILAGCLIYLLRGFMSIETLPTSAEERNSSILGALVVLVGILIIYFSKNLAKNGRRTE